MLQRKKLYPIPLHLISVFLILAVGIAIAGYVDHNIERKEMRKDRESELSAIAELKVSQILRWRKELLGDAAAIQENPILAEYLETYIDTPAIPKLASDVLAWMTSLKANYDCRRVALLDAKAEVLLSIPDERKDLDSEILRLVPQVNREKRLVLSDLYRSEKSNEVSISLVIPILSYMGDEMKCVGYTIIEVDPHRFLFPLAQSWPTPSKTSETALVRRDGDHVLFLNELRHSKDPPLTFRIPLIDKHAPAVLAVRGIRGVVEGIDYRGKHVYAVIHPVSDSPWFLIAKVDEEEVLAPLHDRDLLVFSLAGVFILGAALSIGFIWSHQSSQFFRRQYQTELKRYEMAKRYEFLTQYANDIILLEDFEGRILEANERAVITYGYTRDELLNMNILDIRGRGIVSPTEGLLKSREGLGIVFETVHRRKDGALFPVEVSSRVVQLGGEDFIQSIIRDITERKLVERATHEAQEELEKRVQERTAEFVKANEVLKNEIVERKRMEDALRKSERMLKLRSSQLLIAQETERKRLALDLHDSIGQTLTAIKLGVEDAHRHLKKGECEPESLEPLIRMVQQSIEEVRKIYMNLRPSILDDLGILATIDWFAREMEKIHSRLRINKDFRVVEEEIPEPIKIVIYRILQESLNNITKYSGASEVSIALGRRNGRIELTIRDNGQGFDLRETSSRLNPKGGLGLTSMRERAELSGGDFHIVSNPGEGTELRTSWPCI